MKIFGWLLSAAAAIFAWAVDAASLTKVINSSNIYDSWKIVRDLLNISFILVLLYTAFTIIFQVDSTNKKIILTVVLMALLVNFSFPITRFIIDVGNSLMYTIFQHLLPTTDTIFSNFAEKSAIGQIITETNDSSSVAQILGAIIFVAILTITFLMMAILFVIRIVALAIIIIFSPFGFVGTLFPSLSSKIDWWGNLFKYTFFGPAMAFMIFIATKVMDGAIDAQNSSSAFAKFGQDMNGGSLITGFSNFAIPVVILWIGMGLAQKMGIEGASMAQGWATKAFNFVSGVSAAKWFATKAVPKMTKAGLETFEEGVLAKRGLSPTAFIEGWKQRSKKKREDAIHPATGAWHDRLNYWKSFGNEKTNYHDAAVQASILKKQKELADVSQNSEYLYSEYRAAEEASDTEKMAAVLRIMFSNNDQNEFMKIQKKTVDPFTLRDEIYDRFVAKGMSANDAAKQLADLSEIAISKGNYGNYGMSYFDVKKGSTTYGQYVKVDKKNNQQQVNAAVAKTTNIKLQTKADLWHWNSLFKENPNGTPGELHEVGKGLLEDLKMLDKEGVKRLRNDFVKKVGNTESLNKIRAHAKTLDATQRKIIETFADEIEKLSSGKPETTS